MSNHKTDNVRRWHLPALAVGLAGSALILAGCSGAAPGAEPTPTPTATDAVETTEPTAAPTVVETETAPVETATETEAAEPEGFDPAASGDANVMVLAADYDTTAGTIEVRSIVTNIIGDGTCDILAINEAGDRIEASVEAMPDAQSTVCPTATLEGVTGEGWQVQVSFTSDQGSGVSEAVTAEAR